MNFQKKFSEARFTSDSLTPEYFTHSHKIHVYKNLAELNSHQDLSALERFTLSFEIHVHENL